jgi:hypothetical protein
VRPQIENMPSERKKTFAPIRWSLERAASEFQINPRTLAKRCKARSVEPAEDGKFSTTQICAAVFGDMDSEKLREQHHIANMAARRDRREAGESLATQDVLDTWVNYLSHVRRIIQHDARIPMDSKHAILRELREVNEAEYVKRPNSTEEIEP